MSLPKILLQTGIEDGQLQIVYVCSTVPADLIWIHSGNDKNSFISRAPVAVCANTNEFNTDVRDASAELVQKNVVSSETINQILGY